VITKRTPRQVSKAIDVDALINRGGTPAVAEPLQDPDQIVPILIRMPRKLMEQIDQARKKSRTKMSRNTWLQQAADEKLSREEGQGSFVAQHLPGGASYP
jgi:hypothetical protein